MEEIITALADSVVVVLIPYLKKAAKAVAGKAGENLWNLIKKPFTSKKDKTKLENFKNNPDDENLQAWLKVELKDALMKNPKFLEELKELLPKAEKEAKINIQNITGNNNVSVQDINGGSININQ